MLSVSRIFLLIPLALFLVSPEPSARFWAVGFMLLCTVTDILDGFLARKLNQVTDMGKIIDPLADKIGIGVTVIILVLLGKLPLWYVLTVLGRDVIIFSGGIYISKKHKVVLPSNAAGKVAVIVVGLVLIFATLQMPELRVVYEILFWLSLVLMAVSLCFYGMRFFEYVNPKV
jgi:CDP-diacylglycerol--glycerol-3-phosphate 3-phosphatidyltransferase